MSGIEPGGVGPEGAETRFGAQVDRPAAVLDAREVLRVGVEDSPAEGHEAGRSNPKELCAVRHGSIVLPQGTAGL